MQCITKFIAAFFPKIIVSAHHHDPGFPTADGFVPDLHTLRRGRAGPDGGFNGATVSLLVF